MDRAAFVERELKNWKEKWDLDISASFDMPEGFQNAFGVFDATKNELFLNLSSEIDDARFLFTFFHELRHALQYNFPERFDKDVQKSLPYVIHFDGSCFKLIGGEWKSCSLSEDWDFESAYLSLPYERDANEFAYAQALKRINKSEKERLTNIFNQSLPKRKYNMAQLENIFRKIDDQTNQQKIGDKIIFEKLVGKRIDLVFKNFVHAVPEKKFVDCCNYDIVLHGLDETIGTCSAKLGFNDVLFFIGNVGYEIDENYRGNGYAGEAVELLKQLFKVNHFDKIYITNAPNNNSSRRVCEKLGAQFLGIFEIPEDHIRRKQFGDQFMNIFVLNI